MHLLRWGIGGLLQVTWGVACSKGQSLLEHDFVTTPTLRLIARITKLCWYESEQHRLIVSRCQTFLDKGTPGHYCVGLMLLKAVVQVLPFSVRA